jgi:ABC-type transport system involved in multi-copper enzyme maturation permease subunit
MYAWKFWYDTRYRFYICLIIFVVLCVTVPLGAVAIKNQYGGWSLLRGGSPEHVGFIYKIVWDFLTGPLTVLAGIMLGASGVGEEFKQGSLEFLLAQPRKRNYFVWMGWCVGLTELLVIISIATAVALSALIYVTHSTKLAPRFTAAIPLMFAVAAISYAITYLMTIVTRSARSGIIGTAVVFMVYGGASFLLQHAFQIETPSLLDGLTDWFKQPSTSFVLLRTGGWTAAAAMLGVAAHFIFQQADL